MYVCVVVGRTDDNKNEQHTTTDICLLQRHKITTPPILSFLSLSLSHPTIYTSQTNMEQPPPKKNQNLYPPMIKSLSSLLIITTLLSNVVNAKIDVSPAVAESAARPDDGPSDRVSVEHLDVAKTSEKTKQEATQSSFRFRSMPVQAPVDKFYPPPIQQVELERPEDNSLDEMYLNPMGDKTDPGNGMWMDGDSKAFMMSEMRGAAAQQYMPM